MTDRKLLELAAKAAGVPIGTWVDSWMGEPNLWGFYLDGGNWNPLADDGDALRLAVKLGLTISIDTSGMETEAWIYGNINCDSNERHAASDPYTATRLAIVRAAAELGKEEKC